ncbi:MAG: hypothetical protein KIS66_01710 [Fimbriimonadaceae bacterium]|nr:hypothetical protein [Fimbriimonadaceae bacterium]
MWSRNRPFREWAVALLVFIATFCVASLALAVEWPPCSKNCRQYGPGGGSPNPTMCQACCLQDCSTPIAHRTQCLNCCVTAPPEPDCTIDG